MKAFALLAALAMPAQAAQILHHDAAGNPVMVTVVAADCPGKPGYGCYLQHVVYTMGNEATTSHELAHVAGMRHEPWRFNRWGIPCARVTVAGFSTGYEVGQVICNGLRGEWVER